MSVAEHGPHVDKTKFPDAAFVRLRVLLPALGKSATITRKVSSPKKPKIEPADEDVKAALTEIADHPEVTLSRREILRFILVEPTKRSEEIQAILKLEEIGQTRAALNTAQNRLQTAERTGAQQVQAAREVLQRHLQIATLRADDLLESVNTRREILSLPSIEKLTADTRLDDGLAAATSKSLEFNKQSTLRDLQTLTGAAQHFPELAKIEAAALVADLARLKAEPDLFTALDRSAFIERGLALVDGPGCPLCDHPWASERHLRDHLTAKLAKCAEAQKIQASLFANAAALVRQAVNVAGLLEPVHRIAAGHGEPAFAKLLEGWKVDLDQLRGKLNSVHELPSLNERLSSDWLAVPRTFQKNLAALTAKIEAMPDQSATLDAQTFLSTAQLRLGDYREFMRRSKAAELAASAAKTAYEVYCAVMEDELQALYEDVQEDFSTFYRAINEDDEERFTAKFTPSAGKLDFDVNFYERGLFPPGAFHSEGHQDGMGVCLYLALMKRLFGANFTFALLDDVVMSVDAGHRYQFCKLLKTAFPNTQFVITTHDRLWAEQMKSAGLVRSKTSLAFHSWTVDTGPLVESDVEIWDEITEKLAKGKVEAASAALRHHLEYVARHLADQLGATPAFRADGNYELGELLPAVLSRMKTLCARGADAAQSWGNAAAKDAAVKRRDTLAASSGATNVEQWAVNKAVHYNEWANFGRKDFEPVVAAFKGLLEIFQCDACHGWLYVTPRAYPESLRCACNAVSMNLKNKPK